MIFGEKIIAINFGSSRLRVFIPGSGIVLNIPSVVAINTLTNNVIAIGEEAKNMIGKTPDNILVISPVQNGVIVNFNSAQMLLKEGLKNYIKKSIFTKYKVIVSAPASITDVEKKALEEVIFSIGANEVYVVDEALCAALGCKMNISNITGNMIIDIGGGVTKVAIFSQNRIIASKSIKIAGNEMNSKIIEYIKNKYNIIIGENAAENLKIQLGILSRAKVNEKLSVKGRNIFTGLPDDVYIHTEDIDNAICSTLNEIVKTVEYVIGKVPPEIASDIIKAEVVLSGGGAYMKNLEDYFKQRLNFNFNISLRASDNVILGLASLTENIDEFKKQEKR